MKNFRSFIVIPVLGWLTFFIACTDDEVIPQLPRLTPEQQLLYFLEDSSLFTETRQVIGTNYYFRVEDTVMQSEQFNTPLLRAYELDVDSVQELPDFWHGIELKATVEDKAGDKDYGIVMDILEQIEID